MGGSNMEVILQGVGRIKVISQASFSHKIIQFGMVGYVSIWVQCLVIQLKDRSQNNSLPLQASSFR